ncbi:MAG: dihydrodipicolinate synthase family protein [Calditrichaeota bacterium]|nr:dihydrodipicolinate synthase family protein [Calditrichota bacterium]
MEKEIYPLFGIVAVLNTPFTQNDEIDISALKRHVEAAIQAGVAGFLVPAMASEVAKLSMMERHRMVAAVLEQANGRVPVIGGAGEPDKKRRGRIVKDLLALGCRNILLQIDYRNDDQYSKDVLAIANLGPDMLMLQDWDFGGSGLPLSLILRLFEDIDVFRCLKIETVPAGTKYTAVLNATNGRLHVSGGWAVSQMPEGLERGVHAFMLTGMYEIYTTIYSLYKAGRTAEAQKLFYKILPILSFSNQHLDISIHFFKRLLHRQGIYPTANVREPILPFDDIHERTANRLIEHLVKLIASLSYS